VINPKNKFAMKTKAANLIQKVMHGYQARRKTMYLILDQKTDIMNEHFWRIEKISRGHFQRRIRRAWL
jgi:hypothetical protein